MSRAGSRTTPAPRIHGSESAVGGTKDLDGEADEFAPCPSCHAMMATATSDGHLALLHPMPFCSYFGRTEPEVIMDDIMKCATDAHGIKA